MNSPLTRTPSSSLEQFYRRDIKSLSAIVRVDRRLSCPIFSATRSSKVCGSQVTIDARLDTDDAITEVGYRTRACSLGMAATAILAAQAIGTNGDQLRSVRDLLAARLAGCDLSLPARWRQLVVFDAARDLTARHNSILLPFEAAIAGFDEVRSSRENAT